MSNGLIVRHAYSMTKVTAISLAKAPKLKVSASAPPQLQKAETRIQVTSWKRDPAVPFQVFVLCKQICPSNEVSVVFAYEFSRKH